MMDHDAVEELRLQLLQDRERLKHEISFIEEHEISSGVFQEDEQDAVDQHPADEGSELFEREKNLTVRSTLELSLTDVEDALRRIEDGTYGVCENCGKPIDIRRLRAMPSARFDVECQSKLEQRAAATAG